MKVKINDQLKLHCLKLSTTRSKKGNENAWDYDLEYVA
jgi:hypothetical protein